MSKTRLIKSVVLTCAAFAVALPGCTSEGSESVGGLEVDLTLTFPPGERTEILGEVRIVLVCDGVDQNLGVERSAETHVVNIRTTEGDDPEDPKSMSGLFEKAGIPAPALCDVAGTSVSDSGDTTCEGFLEDVPILAPVDGVPQTTERTMIMNCRTESDSGNLRVDAEYNQCATYREIFTGPTTQSVGNDVRVETWGYDADDDSIKVFVNSDCGPVDMGGVTIASCEEADEAKCQSAVHMVTCETAGSCEIKVLTSDDNFDECNGFFDNGDVDYAARAVFEINCIPAAACGNGILETSLGEECDPCDDDPQVEGQCEVPTGLPTAFCTEACQDINNCEPNPCPQTECNPQTCSSDPDDNSAVCDDNFVAMGTPCGGVGEECDGAGACRVPPACTPDATACAAMACNTASCPAGVCVYTGDPTAEGEPCDSGTGSTVGSCDDSGGCIPDDECTATDVSECNVTNVCWTAKCDTQTGGAYECDEDTDDTNSCATCTNTPACVCDTGSCDNAPVVATCDPTGQGNVVPCLKDEFLAIDCALLNNSAPLPLDVRVTPESAAFANTDLSATPQGAIILPAPLVCGFILSTFTFVQADDSVVILGVSGATPVEAPMASYLCDAVADPTCTPIPNHGPINFDFVTACGCDPRIDATDPTCGTGPGITVPFFPVPPTPAPVWAVGAGPVVTFEMVYGTYNPPPAVEPVGPGVQLNLKNLVGSAVIPSVCVGANCPACEPLFPGDPNCDGTQSTDACSPENRDSNPDTNESPRVMYDATCGKTGFAACGGTFCDDIDTFCPLAVLGQTCDTTAKECNPLVGTGIPVCCAPFETFSDTTDVCIGSPPRSALPPDPGADPPPCCPDGDCTTAAAQTACCAAIKVLYPDANAAQQPQVPVNP